MAIVACGNRALPRDLDVDVSVSKPQTETTTDLTVACAVVKDAPFDHDASRVRFYTSLIGVAEDFATNTEAYKMASAFFSQPVRALRMAIGSAFTTAKAGFMVGGDMGDVATFAAVNNGSFAVTIDGVTADVSPIDFSTATTLDNVASLVQTAVQAADVAFASATVVNSSGRLRINSGTTGDSSAVSVLSPTNPVLGTDVSGPDYLNALFGVARSVDGYTPTTIENELNLITEAARCSGRFLYGFELEASYRDTDDNVDASEWAQSRRAVMTVTSNSANALDPASTTDIGSVISARGDIRTFAFYSDKPEEYPGFALLAYMFHVDYAAAGSTVTAKFKDLVGITPAGISITDLDVLQAKRYNVFTKVGNNSRTVRDGVEANPSWYIDDLINLDNFEEDLQVNVYNVFLRNKKLPININGVTKIEAAIDQICRRYVLNNTLSSRPVIDDTRESGVRIDPPYSITYTALELLTPAERQARVGPPFTIDANLAGAIHSTNIIVNAYS